MRRQLAFVSVTVATLIVLAALIPLATLVRNQTRDRAISAAETDAQSIAAALAVAASIEPNAPLTEELALEVIAEYLDRGEPSDPEPELVALAAALAAAASIEPGQGVTVELADRWRRTYVYTDPGPVYRPGRNLFLLRPPSPDGQVTPLTQFADGYVAG